MQGIISSPHLATIIIYNMLQRWSQYFNSCMAASASDVVEVPGSRVPFSIKPIMVELGGGCYIRQILTIFLADLVAGRRSAGVGATRGGGGGGSSIQKFTPKVGATGGMHK